MKWNESIFRPLLCTCRLNWTRRTSWGWWDESDDTVLQTLDPRGLRPSTLPFGHGSPPQYWVYEWMGKKHFCFFQTAKTGKRNPNSGLKGSGVNHYPRAPALKACVSYQLKSYLFEIVFVDNANISQRLFSWFVVLKINNIIAKYVFLIKEPWVIMENSTSTLLRLHF